MSIAQSEVLETRNIDQQVTRCVMNTVEVLAKEVNPLARGNGNPRFLLYFVPLEWGSSLQFLRTKERRTEGYVNKKIERMEVVGKDGKTV